jgi:hypothetical protein
LLRSIKSQKGSSSSEIKRNVVLRVRISSNEILKKEFRISEIGGRMVVSLSVDSSKSGFEIFEPPDESFKI